MRQARTDASSTSLPSQPAPDNHASRMAARYESGRKCGQGRGHTREDKLRKRETRRLAQERGERQDHLSAIHRNKLLHICVLRCVAVCCSVLQCVAVCCNAICLPYTATSCFTYTTRHTLQQLASHTLQQLASHTLQQLASHTPHTTSCITHTTSNKLIHTHHTQQLASHTAQHLACLASHIPQHFA